MENAQIKVPEVELQLGKYLNGNQMLLQEREDTANLNLFEIGILTVIIMLPEEQHLLREQIEIVELHKQETQAIIA